MFQSYAFQSFAFQTAGVGGGTPPAPVIVGGHFLPAAHGKKKGSLSNVQVIYKKAQALSRKETKILRDIISDFIEPTIAMQPIVPDIVHIDYAALEANQAAYSKFLIELANIRNRLEEIENNKIALLAKQQEEDDELLLMTIISCVIH